MKFFLDIETTDIKADIGQITAIGIMKNDEIEVKFADNPEKEINLLEWFKKEIEDCKLLITWYGSCFDIPFILTRAIILNVNIKKLVSINSLDLCKFCQKRFLFAKYTLSEVAKSLGIRKQAEINWKEMPGLYIKAIQGDREAKNAIIEHCKDDLQALKLIYERIKPYTSGW